ncbi:MAG: Ig-like domain-containing protein [Candidatus Cloacimonetes bacterium]|nr:Ig-like domain-containing protein [Candidatus Cloacimonadota bacterium]
MKTKTCIIICIVFLAILFMGCETTKPDPTVTGVTVEPAIVEVYVGQTYQFTAIVNGNNKPDQDVTWSVVGSNGSSSINSNGVLFVGTGETHSTINVHATSTFDTTKSGYATVNVRIPNITSVVVSPSSVDVARGATQQFNAVVNGSNNPSQEVIWSILGGGTGTSISTNGLLTVSASEPASSITIIATSSVDQSKTGSAMANLTGAIITGVVISPKNINVATGDTQQFTAIVNGSFNPPQTVSWSISGNNSSSTNINSNGLLTVAENESASTITVTVASTVNLNLTDTATVNIASIGGTYNVTDITSWIAAIQGIRNGGNNRIHTINVTEEVNVNVNTEVTFGNVTNIQVTIQGGGTLALTAAGNVLRIGLRHNIILQNITLRGISTNTTEPVVYVAAGGVLTMRNGATVCENGYKGVYVDNGLFNMEGGSIRDNTAYYYYNGAGVYIFNGGTMIMYANSSITNNVGCGIFIDSNSTLTIEGGIIGSNTGGGYVNFYRAGYGAGVFVAGSLVMNGGEIIFNTAYYHGGGVFVASTGSFIMNNGLISGNNASDTNSLGGGVYITNTFIMNGGTISNNSAYNGGGVYIMGGYDMGIVGRSSFTMTGGTITSNNAGNNGGAVYQLWTSNYQSTFTKTGGNIASNSASGNGNTAFHSGTPNRWRNANAGPNVQVDDLFWLND